ncbi:MAG TPA: CotH kinase family protein [Verrucomicrobiales bacterium]|nr:CotH kinase family protein [Verrucomicrobiales bacterium]
MRSRFFVVVLGWWIVWGARGLAQDVHPVLNEIVSSNITGIPDEFEADLQNCPVPNCAQWNQDLGESVYDGDYPDWIEIHNPGESPIALLGYGLSDDPQQPFKWTFPGVSVEPGGELLVFASGKDKAGAHLHTNFKLSRQGETVVLTRPDGAICDLVVTGDIPIDHSLGRWPVGGAEWAILVHPTPGMPNEGPVYLGTIEEVTASPPPGFFPRFPSIELSGNQAGSEIRYTLDGSVPVKDSRLYTAPITSLFGGNRVVRARTFIGDQPASAVLTASYFTGPGHSLPVVSLSTDPQHLWDEELGIYTPGRNANESGRVANYWNDWERPVHVELLETDGTAAFRIDAGLKIFGWGSRSNPQKSLSVMLRDRYGYPELQYRLFPGMPLERFTSFVLRAAGNDSRSNGTFFRDPFASGLVASRNSDVQAYRPAVVYLNGAYWGIYNICEKLNEDYLESHHGVDPDEVDIISRYWRRTYPVVIEGGSEDFLALEEFLETSDMSLPENYARAKERIDMENLLEYSAAQIYIANFDWPGNNNKTWKPQTEGARWRWLMYDLDYALGYDGSSSFSYNTLRHAMASGRSDWPNPHWTTLILRTLAENRAFREALANRMCDLINSVFRPEHAIARLMAMKAVYEPEMEAHIGRWKGEGDVIGSIGSWEANIGTVRTFLERRPESILGFVRSEFALAGPADLMLDVSGEEGGDVEINSILVRTFPWTGVYFPGVDVTVTALPRPGYRFSHWSGDAPAGLRESNEIAIDVGEAPVLTAHFEPAATALNRVVINEINYHSHPEAESGDWVELYNGYEFEIDLSSWRFQDSEFGHRFVLPEGSRVAAGGYVVLAQDPNAFRNVYPESAAQLAGGYNFGLSNGGERLRLFDDHSNLVDEVEYDDGGDWPGAADGGGATLALVRPGSENGDAQNWRASLTRGGTPGSANGFEDDPSDPAPSWKSIRRMPNGDVVLELRGAPGVAYELQRSENLRDWRFWKSIESGGELLRVTDDEAADFPKRSYRARPVSR